MVTMLMETKDWIMRSYLAKGLSAGFVDQLAALAVRETYQDGETIISIGDTGKDLYLLVEGKADILAMTGETFDSILPGAPFGELAMLDGKPRAATVVAAMHCDVLRFPAEPLATLLKENPVEFNVVLQNLCFVLCERLRSNNAYLTVMLAMQDVQQGGH
ncbi:MAG: cyclic nucleotide-binding domain-containing protein [Armatimonadetes bacterium]|nr:cyclic nucleotide-binding domain-containing protein [Armatimonadota bacterium]